MKHGIEVPDEYPAAGLALVVALAALAYVVVTGLFAGGVNVLATAVVPVVFATAHVGFSLCLELSDLSESDR